MRALSSAAVEFAPRQGVIRMTNAGPQRITTEHDDAEIRLVRSFNQLGPIIPVPEPGQKPTRYRQAKIARIEQRNSERTAAARVILGEMKTLSRGLAARQQLSDEDRDGLVGEVILTLAANPRGSKIERPMKDGNVTRRRLTTPSLVRAFLRASMRNRLYSRWDKERPEEEEGRRRPRPLSIHVLEEAVRDAWEKSIDSGYGSGAYLGGLLESVTAEDHARWQELFRSMPQEIAGRLSEGADRNFLESVEERIAVYESRLELKDLVASELKATATSTPSLTDARNRVYQRHHRALKKLYDETIRRFQKKTVSETVAALMLVSIENLRRP